jgi:transposase
MVANPHAVRHFAQAMMEHNKNDRVDAGALLEFAARMPFEPWRPTSWLAPTRAEAESLPSTWTVASSPARLTTTLPNSARELGLSQRTHLRGRYFSRFHSLWPT